MTCCNLPLDPTVAFSMALFHTDLTAHDTEQQLPIPRQKHITQITPHTIVVRLSQGLFQRFYVAIQKIFQFQQIFC